jgi:hypothetical protein
LGLRAGGLLNDIVRSRIYDFGRTRNLRKTVRLGRYRRGWSLVPGPFQGIEVIVTGEGAGSVSVAA